MKKYLFNKIQIKSNGNVEFKPFRKATLRESFLAYTHAHFDQKNWQFIPTSFKEFLKMLSITKLNEAGEYDVDIELNIGHFEPLTFDVLLQHFASEMYNINSPNERDLQDFYTRAYQTKQDAQLDQSLLDTDPSEFVNQ